MMNAFLLSVVQATSTGGRYVINKCFPNLMLSLFELATLLLELQDTFQTILFLSLFFTDL